MTDDEKILKFAGFTWSPGCSCGRCCPSGWIPPGFDKDDEEYATRPDTTDLTWLFKWCVPKSGMDALWIINNLAAPIPEIQYCFGFVRGKDNDLICWSQTLLPDQCLSPICDTPGEALRAAVLAPIGEADGREDNRSS